MLVLSKRMCYDNTKIGGYAVNKTESKMLDAPQGQSIGVVLIAWTACFLTMPFVLRLLGVGSEQNHGVFSWFELAVYLICFVTTVPAMKEYLSFNWYNTQGQMKEIAFYAIVFSLAFLLYTAFCQAVVILWQVEFFIWLGQCTLPIFPTNLFLTNSYIISLNPVFGTICAVLIAPITTSCIYYGAFAKGYNKRPWLGYAVVALLTLLPRLATGMTLLFSLTSSLTMYVVQLPVHMACCWLYQKTDTIWTPVFCQGLANLVACFLSVYHGG